MTTATPDYRGDLKAKITALRGADFPATRVSVDGEDPVGGVVDEEHTWVKLVGNVDDDYDKDGAIRAFVCQVKHRFDVVKDPKGATAITRMTLLHDASNKLGAWTGASGAVYVDLRCTFPQLLEDHYVVMDMTAEFDSIST